MLSDVELFADAQGEVALRARLDRIFAALSDATRRDILEILDRESLLVSEIARRFPISVQAVSRHIHVLVGAGLVRQERSGRISRCSLNADPILDAAVWINRYSKYWQAQFDELSAWLRRLDAAGDATRAGEDDGKGGGP
ncbi:MAG TPA: metalloregulator ArsR/SmtB family transcription factor [Paracoccaceae bacterium]|nr:metalloregulator ArsR/SmtB family transcription factor [Paracoccaceae bacterium]